VYSRLDYIPSYGVTKAEHDKWAEKNDRPLTQGPIVQHLLSGKVGKVPPRSRGERH